MSNAFKTLELHVHTASSPDSGTTYEEMVRFLELGKIDKIAITDHSVIDMAFRLYERFPERIIIGEEIMSTEGEIVGLFLHKEIPAGLPPLEVIEQIRAQGGVVYLPHPFDRRRASVFQSRDLAAIFAHTDIIEVFNARVWWNKYNVQAQQVAQLYNILSAVGSDAHTIKACGRAYQLVPDFQDAKSFLKALEQAQLIRVRSPLYYMVNPTVQKIYKKYFSKTSSPNE